MNYEEVEQVFGKIFGIQLFCLSNVLDIDGDNWKELSRRWLSNKDINEIKDFCETTIEFEKFRDDGSAVDEVVVFTTILALLTIPGEFWELYLQLEKGATVLPEVNEADLLLEEQVLHVLVYFWIDEFYSNLIKLQAKPYKVVGSDEDFNESVLIIDQVKRMFMNTTSFNNAITMLADDFEQKYQKYTEEFFRVLESGDVEEEKIDFYGDASFVYGMGSMVLNGLFSFAYQLELMIRKKYNRSFTASYEELDYSTDIAAYLLETEGGDSDFYYQVIEN